VSDIRLKLTKVAEFDQPVGIALRAGDDGLYVIEKGGTVRVLRGGAVADGTVLDLSSEVSTGSEQGLLGVAFSPDGNLLYASFTNRAGDSRLWEYRLADGRADPGSRREVMAHDQPFANHNGGQVTFGPDGLLYWFMGDGGSGGDPQGNGQKLSTRLGKVLRINPASSGSAAYTIPPDNPFVGRSGALPEIYAYGLRNPWRNSFDRATGDLWIGDVGQNASEEIDWAPAGQTAGVNYGWSAFEGTKPFNPAVQAEGHRPPVHEYPNPAQGCSVTGGYVYRGEAIPTLTGVYVFADFCEGRLLGLRLEGGKATDVGPLNLQVDSVSSFGEDAAGNVYVFSLAGGMFRIDGA
jgi:glucose/arabinose dehydrogenase